jgi:hypothetical protein
MKNHPDSLIITVDDDIFYPSNLVEKLYHAYLKENDCIHCHRGHKMAQKNGALLPYKQWEYSTKSKDSSLMVFPTGVGGVLYFPGCLDEDALNHELFMRICPNADDVWLKAMSLKKGVKCKTIPRIAPFRYEFPNIPYSQEVTLKRDNKKSGGNNDKIQTVFTYFSLFKKL